MASLQIREIYRSIQGESSFAGWPCVFVRTGGCDIRCGYCDEPHALSGGDRMSVETVLARVQLWQTRLVEVTGGEPGGPLTGVKQCTLRPRQRPSQKHRSALAAEPKTTPPAFPSSALAAEAKDPGPKTRHLSFDVERIFLVHPRHSR